jgi:hypothetical protein
MRSEDLLSREWLEEFCALVCVGAETSLVPELIVIVKGRRRGGWAGGALPPPARRDTYAPRTAEAIRGSEVHVRRAATRWLRVADSLVPSVEA